LRAEIIIFKSVKELILKIPVIRKLFVKSESYIFDIFKIFDIRRIANRNRKNLNIQNEKLILNFKNFYERNFFDKKIIAFIKYTEKSIRSAWRGHHYFALWLVKELHPSTIVELGVDRGFSSFMFGAQNIGRVYGIDWFMGDSFLGKKFDDYIPVMRNKKKIEKKFGIRNVTIIKGKFSEVAQKWYKKIDILHIDGSHSYEDVKEDYQTWSQFLNGKGIILFHDTDVYEGVKQFFNELELPKFNFTHSFGLGVLSKNKELILKIQKMWDL